MENIKNEVKIVESSSLLDSSTPINSSKVTESLIKEEASGLNDCDEIIILPTPEKPKPLLITIDDSEENQTVPQNSINASNISSSVVNEKSKADKKKKRKKSHVQNTYTVYNSNYFYSNFHRRALFPRSNYQTWNAALPFNTYPTNFQFRPISNNFLMNNLQYGIYRPPVSIDRPGYNINKCSKYRVVSQNNCSSRNVMSSFNYGNSSYNNHHSTNSKWVDSYYYSEGRELHGAAQLSSHQNDSLVSNLNQSLASSINTDQNSSISQASASVHYTNYIENQPSLTNYSERELSQGTYQLSTQQNTNLIYLNQSFASNYNTDQNPSTSQVSASEHYTNHIKNQPSTANYSERELSQDACQLSSQQNTNLIYLNPSLTSKYNTDQNSSISQVSTSEQCSNYIKNLNQPPADNYPEKESSNHTHQLSSQPKSNVSYLNQSLASKCNTDQNSSISQISASEQCPKYIENLNQPSAANYSERELSKHVSQLYSQQNANPNDLNQSLASDVNSNKSFSVSQLCPQQNASSGGNLTQSFAAYYSEKEKSSKASQSSSYQNANVINNLNQPLVSNIINDKICSISQDSTQHQYANSAGKINQPYVVNLLEKGTSNDAVLLTPKQNTDFVNNSKQSLASNISTNKNYKQNPKLIYSSNFTNETSYSTDKAKAKRKNYVSNQLPSDSLELTKSNSNEVNPKQVSQKSIVSEPCASSVSCLNPNFSGKKSSLKQNALNITSMKDNCLEQIENECSDITSKQVSKTAQISVRSEINSSSALCPNGTSETIVNLNILDSKQIRGSVQKSVISEPSTSGVFNPNANSSEIKLSLREKNSNIASAKDNYLEQIENRCSDITSEQMSKTSQITVLSEINLPNVLCPNVASKNVQKSVISECNASPALCPDTSSNETIENFKQNCGTVSIKDNFLAPTENNHNDITSKQINETVQKSVVSDFNVLTIECPHTSSSEIAVNVKQNYNSTAYVKGANNSVGNIGFVNDVNKSQVSLDAINLRSLLTVLLGNASKKSSKMCEKNEEFVTTNSHSFAEKKSLVNKNDNEENCLNKTDTRSKDIFSDANHKSPDVSSETSNKRKSNFEKNGDSGTTSLQTFAKKKSPINENISEKNCLSKIDGRNRNNFSEANHKSPEMNENSEHADSETSNKRKSNFEKNRGSVNINSQSLAERKSPITEKNYEQNCLSKIDVRNKDNFSEANHKSPEMSKSSEHVNSETSNKRKRNFEKNAGSGSINSQSFAERKSPVNKSNNAKNCLSKIDTKSKDNFSDSNHKSPEMSKSSVNISSETSNKKRNNLEINRASVTISSQTIAERKSPITESNYEQNCLSKIYMRNKDNFSEANDKSSEMSKSSEVSSETSNKRKSNFEKNAGSVSINSQSFAERTSAVNENNSKENCLSKVDMRNNGNFSEANQKSSKISESSVSISSETSDKRMNNFEKREGSVITSSQTFADRKNPVNESNSEKNCLSEIDVRSKNNFSDTNHKLPEMTKNSEHVSSKISNKRKKNIKINNVSKKQKNYHTENFEASNTSKSSEQKCVNNKSSNFLNTEKRKCVSSVMSPLPTDQQISLSSEINSNNVKSQAQDTNSITANNVKVRKDCANNSVTNVARKKMKSAETTNNILLNCNIQNSKTTSSTKNMSDKENVNCVNKKSVGSVCNINTDISTSQRDVTTMLNSSSSSDHSEIPSNAKNLDSALKKIFNLASFGKKYGKKLPRHPELLQRELRILDSHVKTVKQGISNTKSKIQEYDNLCRRYRKDENRLCRVQADLNKKINCIQNLLKYVKKTSENKKNSKRSSEVCLKANQCTNHTLQIANIVGTSSTSKRLPTSPVSQKSPSLKNDKSVSTLKPKHSVCKNSRSANTAELSGKGGNASTSVSDQCDEVLILPTPVKQHPPVITLDDDDVESTSVNQCNKNIHNDMCQSGKQMASFDSGDGHSTFPKKKFTAHSELINNIVIFEDFLYTCSNDNTAKRFSLQDSSLSITYLHSAKNVMDIIVEKINDTTIVCTSNSNNVISLFRALSGDLIKSFDLDCSITSICKGWGKVYAGCDDGFIYIFTWQSKHLLCPVMNAVKTGNPISRIATTYEGHLPFLIILSSDGKIFLRGAQTATLIRCIDGKVAVPSFLSVYKNLAYFCSPFSSLHALNFVTRKIEKKMFVDQFVIGIAISDDFLFTICANSGVVTCYEISTMNKKMYYGAGKKNLTCMHVHNNWIFTGSSRGSVSAFKFDPHDSNICRFQNCNAVYGTKEDLEFHVKVDHLPQSQSCYWNKCIISFRKTDDIKVKMTHMKMHIS